MVMNRDTPARVIKAKDLAANTEAMVSCLYKITGHISCVLDIRYGLGGWAKAVCQRFPQTVVLGFEADPETAKNAWTSDRVRLVTDRWYPKSPHKCPYKPGLLLADFNTATMKSRSEIDEAVEAILPRFFLFTDVAAVKLHLNYRFYGLHTPSLDKYWNTFALPGYELVAWCQKHHAASTGLFVREQTQTQRKRKPPLVSGGAEAVEISPDVS